MISYRSIPIEILEKYAEFDRSIELTDAQKCANAMAGIFTINIDKLAENILENGQTDPLTLTIFGNDNSALLTDGNHRLVAIKKAKLRNALVRVEYFDYLPESDYKMHLSEKKSSAKELTFELYTHITNRNSW